jgi:hypothetical protein
MVEMWKLHAVVGGLFFMTFCIDGCHLVYIGHIVERYITARHVAPVTIFGYRC